MCIILSSFAYCPNVVAKKVIIGIEDNPECKDRCALELMISWKNCAYEQLHEYPVFRKGKG